MFFFVYIYLYILYSFKIQSCSTGWYFQRSDYIFTYKDDDVNVYIYVTQQNNWLNSMSAINYGCSRSSYRNLWMATAMGNSMLWIALHSTVAAPSFFTNVPSRELFTIIVNHAEDKCPVSDVFFVARRKLDATHSLNKIWIVL